MPRSEKPEGRLSSEQAVRERGEVSYFRPVTLSDAQIYKEWKSEVPAQFRHIVESAMLGKAREYQPTGLPKVDGFLS
ncbi:hypothetical protein KKD42_02185 [Patescibacteria group bacterium]|nr:hypothetical protein [Patescibacteria group bacterium]